MNIREYLVTAKALAYAIRTIESLPERWQEFSDKEDMKRVLHEHFSVFEQVAYQSAEHHLKEK